MKLLALDTSTEACTVAVSIDGRALERFSVGGNHSEQILPMVHELLAEAGASLKELDAIVFGRGPGSFTGLRIAAGVTQGLAFGADRPVVPVSSLAVLAQGQNADRVLAAFDARMQQVYWGAYVRGPGGLVELEGEESVLVPADVPKPKTAGWLGAGSGWDRYHQALLARVAEAVTDWRPNCYPHAADLACLGEVAVRAGRIVAANEATPIYIRDNVATAQSR